MIDYDKVNEYITTMLLKSGSCAQLTNIALDDLFGAKNQVISEKDLHDGIEYISALHKKDVEETVMPLRNRKKWKRIDENLF